MADNFYDVAHVSLLCRLTKSLFCCLTCRTALFECSKQTIVAYDKLLHYCNVKIVIYHFLNDLSSFEHCRKTAFYCKGILQNIVENFSTYVFLKFLCTTVEMQVQKFVAGKLRMDLTKSGKERQRRREIMPLVTHLKASQAAKMFLAS